MKCLRFFILILLVLLVIFPTGGQSLVMSGNEIFEQENIPKKSKINKNKEVEQKSLKQKGTVNVPALKNSKSSTNQQPATNKDTKNNDKIEKKPKVSAISTSEEKIYTSFFSVLIEIFILLLYSFV
jgi:ABC-type Na+ efflux pump permease subunit